MGSICCKHRYTQPSLEAIVQQEALVSWVQHQAVWKSVPSWEQTLMLCSPSAPSLIQCAHPPQPASALRLVAPKTHLLTLLVPEVLYFLILLLALLYSQPSSTLLHCCPLPHLLLPHPVILLTLVFPFWWINYIFLFFHSRFPVVF